MWVLWWVPYKTNELLKTLLSTVNTTKWPRSITE